MTDVAYLLGAGFNLSVMDTHWRQPPPLARNFFQLLITSGHLRDRLDAVRRSIYIDILLDEIARYWHLSLDDLEHTPFDIEECLTLLQSKASDAEAEERRLSLKRAQYALRNLILMYLSDMLPLATSPAARTFGQDVLSSSADVLTFNYDSAAESALELAGGIGPKPMPDAMKGVERSEVPPDDLDASHTNWKSALAYGFQFDEVPLPVAGPSYYVNGNNYYAHPANQLYEHTRVLKLHGSVDWLSHTGRQLYPVLEGQMPDPPHGLVLGRHPTTYWNAEPPHHGHWQMEPLIIPPHLYKNYRRHPLPVVWQLALDVLSRCDVLIVVGYSFPPTDFRTRRLFLEAFSDHSLRELAVVNPDGSVVDEVRRLTHFQGPAITCADLPSLYGVPVSWQDFFSVPSTAPAGQTRTSSELHDSSDPTSS